MITGIGMVTPIGTGWQDTWRNALAGTSGAARISSFDASNMGVQIACEIDDFDPEQFMDRRAARRMDRFSQVAVAAARLALDDAAIDPTGPLGERTGAFIGSGIGGLATFVEQISLSLERGSGAPLQV